MKSVSDELEFLLEESLVRYKSILGLPSARGKTPYNTIIMDILKFVHDNRPSLEEYNSWFERKFSANRDVMYNTRKILERANLIRLSMHNMVEVTVDGEACFERDPNVVMAKSFLQSYHGMLEILFLLRNGPQKRSELFQLWYSNYEQTFGSSRSKHTSWEQFSRQLQYLRGFSVVILDKGVARLNEEILLDVIQEFKRP